MMVLNEEKLILLAIADNAKSVVAELMNSLMGEYLEGYNDHAGKLFNTVWKYLTLEMKHKTLHTCPFESVANKLAKENNIPEPWEKIGEFKWKYIGTEKNPYETH
jgi:hypothetical protein